MRTNKEITLAIDLLDEYGGDYRHEQANVLRDRMSESLVFDTYVINMSEKQKNEALFFAAREAAQYVAGKLTIQELIPDLPDGVLEELMKQEQEEEDTFTLSASDYKALLKRMEKLEEEIHTLRKKSEVASTTTATEHFRKNHINQSEATKYIGCSRRTLELWRNKGLVIGYKSGNCYYYRKSDLDSSPTVVNYKKTKQP